MLNSLKEHVLDFSSQLGSRNRPEAEDAPYWPSQPSSGDIRILLAVLTTGARDGSLQQCVEAISRVHPVNGVRLDLLLVQNGKPAITAAVEDLRDRAPMSLSVVLEPRKGIPIARNRAILEAINVRADYIAFIDDDAEPDQDWLVEAVRVLRHYGSEAVTGPQDPVFPDDAPERLRRASIYKAVDHNADRPCRWAASNNVIFSVPFVRDNALLLNENFTTGGSDKEFFKRFTDKGGTIRWAPNSIVREFVIPERLTIKWAIKRSWRLGTTGFRIESSVRPAGRARLVCLVKGGCYIAGGFALLPCILVPRHPGLVDGLCYIAHGAGFILGLSSRFRLQAYV